MDVRYDKISASAVSQILGREGLKRASKKGYTTGFDVVGVSTAVYVYVQDTNDEKRQEVINRILGIFNNRPGYSATYETPTHMVGIDDSEVIHVRRPVQVVQAVEVPRTTVQEALADLANALNGRGFFIQVMDQQVNTLWAVPFSQRMRRTSVSFDEIDQAYYTPLTVGTFPTLAAIMAHLEASLVEPGER